MGKTIWSGPTNKARATRFFGALRDHATHGGLSPEAIEEDTRDLIADLLADARHFCDREGLAFHEIDARAYRNYSAEVVGERHQKREKKTRARKAVHVCGDECRSLGCRIADGREVSR